MKLDIDAGPGALDEVQGALDTFWSLHDEVPRRIRLEVGIAATEIAANIVEHCHALRIAMEIVVRRDEVEVDFTDTGDAPDVDLQSTHMPDELAERGRGLPMAQAALRLLSYVRDEFGNHWRLVSKGFSGADGAADSQC